MDRRILVFIPTYNEHENVERMCRELLGLGLPLDVLFMDDNSPDGTGRILDRLAAEHARVRVIHRERKSGVGGAHLAGIRLAYDEGYETLITMDCDFTHSPVDIHTLLRASHDADLALGSRFMRKGSLPGWTLLRRFLTHLGHALTRNVLGINADATGAFRVYNLKRIDRAVFDAVTSKSYSFFFESLFILLRNGYRVAQAPIVLPARTYGHSKMSFRDAARSARFLIGLRLESAINPARFRKGRKVPLNRELVDVQNWDAYWQKKHDTSSFVYELIAAVYRGLFIRPNLERALRRTFPKGASLLHAGCGSGQVDQRLHGHFRITAIDISPEALFLYSQHNPDAAGLAHASIFDLPYPDASFDGVYNLGVMEHFLAPEIDSILRELTRVLKPGGRLLLFWPHRHATSVYVLHWAHVFLRKVLKRQQALHPPEPSLLRGRRQAMELMSRSGLKLTSYTFGPRDLFIQAILVGSPAPRPAAAPGVIASASRPLDEVAPQMTRDVQEPSVVRS
jgi:dolichol-phosphate mannosyltransferase